MTYQRVLPRDLFNESKLLKCLGQLALLVHEGMVDPLTFEHELPEEGFDIRQNPLDGSLLCANLCWYVNGHWIDLWSRYNSKDPYPLQFEFGDMEEPISGDVFEDDGSLTEEFQEVLRCGKIAAQA